MMCKISATLLTLLFLFGASAGTVQSQNPFIDQDKLQRQIDGLRSEVDQLKIIVGTFEKAKQKRDVGSHETTQEKIPPPAKQDIDNLTPAEHAKIKAEVCKAVGHFFEQIDEALQLLDGNKAGELMDHAVNQLQSTIDKYGKGKRLRNLINLANDLAYDTDWAVRLKSSTSGNEDFIQTIKDYKDKYKKRCSTP